jgi:hypothetical protein
MGRGIRYDTVEDIGFPRTFLRIGTDRYGVSRKPIRQLEIKGFTRTFLRRIQRTRIARGGTGSMGERKVFYH